MEGKKMEIEIEVSGVGKTVKLLEAIAEHYRNSQRFEVVYVKSQGESAPTD